MGTSMLLQRNGVPSTCISVSFMKFQMYHVYQDTNSKKSIISLQAPTPTLDCTEMIFLMRFRNS